MSQSWDTNLKQMINDHPQAFADWLTGMAGIKITGRKPTELLGRKIEADALLEAVVNDQAMLLHVEFQSSNDKYMPERLLEYSFRAKQKHKKVVYSCVIFLRKDGIVPEPPLRWELPNGEHILYFQFLCVKLWELVPEDLLALGQPALLPLVLLTKGGASRTMVEKMFAGLHKGGLTNLFSVGYALASLAFTDEDDQAWLLRRYTEMTDILKETPMYRHMTQEARQDGWTEGLAKGIEKGMEKGMEKGLGKGRAEGLQQAIVSIVAERFPTLTQLTQAQVLMLDEPDRLQQLVVRLSVAQSAEDAKWCLVNAIEDEIGRRE